MTDSDKYFHYAGPEQPEREQQCWVCHFYETHMSGILSSYSLPGDEGWCRRYAPRALVSREVLSEKPQRSVYGPPEPEWPSVSSEDWCGDFQRDTEERISWRNDFTEKWQAARDAYHAAHPRKVAAS